MKELKKYIAYISQVLSIKEPEVYFHDNGKFYNSKMKRTKAFELKPTSIATTTDEAIYFDLDKCSQGIEYVLLAHELRHVYQKEAIEREDPAEPIQLWKQALENYHGSQAADHEENPLEIDANAFAYIVAVHLFKREIWIKGPQQIIKDRIEKLEKKYGPTLSQHEKNPDHRSRNIKK